MPRMQFPIFIPALSVSSSVQEPFVTWQSRNALTLLSLDPTQVVGRGAREGEGKGGGGGGGCGEE
jgi:hypothetical protein